MIVIKNFFLLTLFFLQACASPKIDPPPGLTYLQSAPFRLQVSHIEINQQYVPQKKSPSVEHLFAVPLYVMVQQWIQDRFTVQPNAEDVAVITIEDASVTEERLEGTPGLEGLFVTDLSERYTGRVALKIEIKDAQGNLKGYANASAIAKRTVSEAITFKERQQVWTILTEDLMNQLNGEIERNIQSHLFNFIVP